MSLPERLDDRYRAFVAALEARPADVSPLRFVSTIPNRPLESSAWLMRWLKENRR